VYMEPETTNKIASNAVLKGDVLAVARVAGIQAAKRTPDLIPLCHQLTIGSVYVNFVIGDADVEVEATVETIDRTGVEMEAMTACAVAALTIYDMVKSTDRSVFVSELALWEKAGGKNGGYRRSDPLVPPVAPQAPTVSIDDTDVDGLWVEGTSGD